MPESGNSNSPNNRDLIVWQPLLPARNKARDNSERGRPNSITPEVLNKLRDAFLIGCTDDEAAFYANISRTTLYEHQKNNPEFTDWKDQLKQNPFLMARQTIVRNLQHDPDLALKYMERKRKKEFSPSATLNVENGRPDHLEEEQQDVISNAMSEHFKRGLKKAKNADNKQQ